MDLIEHVQIPIDEIINFWFPNADFDSESAFDFWFDKTPDTTIITKYKYLVDNINEYNYKLIINYYQLNYDLTKIKLVLLLIGDQFTRNIYRDKNDMINYKKNDNWCIKLAIEMLDSNEDLNLNLNMRYFILLVLRHQNKSELLNIVIKRLNKYILLYTEAYTKAKTILQLPKSLIKFYTYTIKNYTYLVDEIKTVKTKLIKTDTSICFYQMIQQTDSNILDEMYWEQYISTSQHILTLQHIPTHIIYQTLIDWLKTTKIKRIGISL